MKKRVISLMLAIVVLSTTACGKVSEDKACSCGCEYCCGGEKASIEEISAKDIFITDASTEIKEMESEEESKIIETSESITTNEQNSESEQTEEASVNVTGTEETTQEIIVANLSDGEKAARRQLQDNLYAARNEIYRMESSIDKTRKINEIDKQIIANNCYDFSDKTIQFIGDSITEAVCGKLKEDGTRISYTDYANDYLHFGNLMVNGKAGRMYTDYAGDDYSLQSNLNNLVYIFSDVAVVFLGVNDYLTPIENKRYGDADYSVVSNAGYCGAIRRTMKFFHDSLPDMEVFYVMTYNLPQASTATFSDASPSPTYGDFMNKIKEYADVSGAHVIDLYNTGFLDCADKATSDTYLADGIHPNDEGNKILGEHIAAELVYYFSHK